MEDLEFEHIANNMRHALIVIGKNVFADSEDAEDVAQEALIRLWLLRERIQTKEEAQKLVVRIARNYAVSLWRRKEKREVCIQEATEPLILSSPDHLMEEEENTRILSEAIQHLPLAYQHILRLNMETGMGVPQIAAVTGIARNSVTVMLSTARKQILDELKKKKRL